jgi:ribosomal protein S6
MEYEICYLIGEAKEANLEKIRKDVEKVITTHKGSLLEGEFVRKRRMAYEIKKEARGTYVAKRFTLPGKDERDEKYPGEDFIGEITKDLNFNQDLLRFIIVKADELPSLEELEELVKEAAEAKKDGRRDFNKETSHRKERTATPVKKAPVVKEEKDASSKAEVKEVKKETPTKEEKKETPKEKPKKKKEESKDDISEDNIDEKLDEILDI